MVTKIIFPLAFLTTFLCLNNIIQAQEKYTINVNVNVNVKPSSYKMAYLSYNELDKTIMDSVEIKNGKFKFIGSVVEPTLATLRLKGSADIKLNRISFYLNNESYKIKKGQKLHNLIALSPINKQHQEYLKKLQPADSVLRLVDRRWTEAGPLKRKEKVFFDDLQTIRQPALVLKKQLQLDYIVNNPNIFFSIISLKEALGRYPNISLFDEYYPLLTDEIKSLPSTVALKNMIDDFRAISIGAKATDFALPDTTGALIRLSDFKGKYVL